MPRSFLVKTHPSTRVPNYGQLETQRGRGRRAPQPGPRAWAAAGQEGEPGGHLSQVGGEELALQHSWGRGPGAGGR